MAPSGADPEVAEFAMAARAAGRALHRIEKPGRKGGADWTPAPLHGVSLCSRPVSHRPRTPQAERLHMGVWTRVSNLLRATPSPGRNRSVKAEDPLTLTPSLHSGHTVLADRDTWKLFLQFASRRSRKTCVGLALADLKADTVRRLLDYLERERHNSVPTRNICLATIHSFFQYVASINAYAGGDSLTSHKPPLHIT